MALTAEEITSEIAVLGEKIKQAKIEKKTQEFWGEFLQSMLALKVRFIVNESTRLDRRLCLLQGSLCLSYALNLCRIFQFYLAFPCYSIRRQMHRIESKVSSKKNFSLLREILYILFQFQCYYNNSTTTISRHNSKN